MIADDTKDFPAMFRQAEKGVSNLFLQDNCPCQIKKKTYRLTLKHKKATKSPDNIEPKLSARSNNGWRWFILKSQQLVLRQQKLIFQAYNLYKSKSPTLPLDKLVCGAIRIVPVGQHSLFLKRSIIITCNIS